MSAILEPVFISEIILGQSQRSSAASPLSLCGCLTLACVRACVTLSQLILIGLFVKHNSVEWALAFTVMGFHLTFALDLKGAQVTLDMSPSGGAEALLPSIIGPISVHLSLSFH